MKAQAHPAQSLWTYISSPRFYTLLFIPVGLILFQASRRTRIVLETPEDIQNVYGIMKLRHNNSTSNNTVRARKFCGDVNDTVPCIFHIGFRDKNDPMMFLANGEFRVVSFDASSRLVINIRKKFSNDIAENRYRVVHSLIVPEKSGTYLFWQNKVRPSFSSIHEKEGCRAVNGTKMPRGYHRYCKLIRFSKRKRQNCRQLIQRHGAPTVLKSDIKEADSGCINSLFRLPEAELPQLVAFAGAAQLKYLSRLDAMGYTKFRVVNQALLDATMPMTSLHLEQEDVSWGDHVLDQFIGANWYSLAEMRKQYPLSAQVDGVKISDSEGYDLHASF